jgi:peptidoglycan hydrolase-like protein with peptidoglycan-binding domain
MLAGAAALVAVGATGGAVAVSSGKPVAPATSEPPANTATVDKTRLSAMVSVHGTLGYRAASDGSPSSVVNQSRGIYTKLPAAGDEVQAGDELYRVDDQPVLLLRGTVPAYRDLHRGDAGNDVRQLNQNLHALGYDADAAIDPDDTEFTSNTEHALEALQHGKGFDVAGTLAVGDAVFLPDTVLIANVAAKLGGPSQPGAAVFDATSDTLEVRVDLEASQQGQVQQGDSARITLPGNRSVTGKVDRLGRVAQVRPGPDNNVGDATIPAFITLDDAGKAQGLDRAPVQVDITTEGVESALSVPVTAIVGKAGGGFAVEVVGDGGRRELVEVGLGLFDTTAGRVEVDGDVREGDRVVVPSL